MADFALQRNIGALICARRLAPLYTLTAGTVSNNVLQTGVKIDRLAFQPAPAPSGLDIMLTYDGTMTAGKTLSITAWLYHSPDGVTWTQLYGPNAPAANQNTYWGPITVPVVTAAATGAVSGVVRVTLANPDNPSFSSPNVYNNGPNPAAPGFLIQSAARFIQLQYTPVLSNTATDSVSISATGVFAGWNGMDAPL